MNISHIYQGNNKEYWEFRMFGWIPSEVDKVKRGGIISFIQKQFEDLEFWMNTLGCELDIESSTFIDFYSTDDKLGEFKRMVMGSE